MIQKPRNVRTPRRPVISEGLAHRVPPGQFVTPRWPVLHQGDVPEFDPSSWTFRVWGLVDAPMVWTWDEFCALPVVTAHGDLHCVTRWSSLDHQWAGVHPRTIVTLAAVRPEARFVVLHGEGGYSANLTLDTFLGDDVLLATRHNGEPLTAQHGQPLRAVIPGRYAWKSVKWLRELEFLAEDRPGFWEEYGYSNSAEVWGEERFDP